MLIRLGECPVWSESSLGAQVILLVLSCFGSYSFISFRNVWMALSTDQAPIYVSNVKIRKNWIPEKVLQTAIIVKFEYE